MEAGSLLMLIAGTVGALVILSGRGLWWFGRRKLPPGTWDVIVVPGCAVRVGGEPSVALRRRTMAGVTLWKDQRAPLLMLTGGVGRHGPAESVVAARIARDAGVPEVAIAVEQLSRNTETNGAFAARALGSDKRVLVVSDPYHVFRCERVFKRYFQEARGVGTSQSFDIRNTLRELQAVAAYGLRGRL